jgi:EAL domain-containing protein (putative c-di-GMP-specific phosphodiesterase class I)
VSTKTGQEGAQAFLEHYPEPGEAPQRIVLDHFPFQIGRGERASYVLFSRQVSKEHAEVRRETTELFSIHDLGSTNGTFVNGKRVAQSALSNGDVIHIANKEFRFGFRPMGNSDSITSGGTECVSEVVPLSILLSGKHLRELLNQHLVSAVFQPIVELDSLAVLGYECLGRGIHAELTQNPIELFGLAERCQLAAELSRSFRLAGVKDASRLAGRTRLFFNLHPSEMLNERLLHSLCEALAVLGADRRMVVEIHEDLVTDPSSLRRLRDRLREMGVGLAYDDFGAGQARLAELAEVPPDYVKLDMKLMRGIDQSRPRQEVVQALVKICADLGVQVIAEGIETMAEAAVCQYLGCAYGQGYYFGRPQPVSGLLPRRQSDTRRIQVSQLFQKLNSPDKQNHTS